MKQKNIYYNSNLEEISFKEFELLKSQYPDEDVVSVENEACEIANFINVKTEHVYIDLDYTKISKERFFNILSTNMNLKEITFDIELTNTRVHQITLISKIN